RATLEEIITGIDRLNDLSQQVAAATGEQACGIHQINEGVADLDQMVQANAAGSEQTAAGCQELSGLAERLVDVVDRIGTATRSRAVAGSSPGPSVDLAPAGAGIAN
ncbi:methyl-accepting chemotaxis protein, partial [bacterium]|nr:methyl-accepting chemotaxis protein [bacterium]